MQSVEAQSLRGVLGLGEICSKEQSPATTPKQKKGHELEFREAIRKIGS